MMIRAWQLRKVQGWEVFFIEGLKEGSFQALKLLICSLYLKLSFANLCENKIIVLNYMVLCLHISKFFVNKNIPSRQSTQQVHFLFHIFWSNFDHLLQLFQIFLLNFIRLQQLLYLCAWIINLKQFSNKGIQLQILKNPLNGRRDILIMYELNGMIVFGTIKCVENKNGIG